MGTKALGPLLLLPVIWGGYYVATNAAVVQMSVFSVGIVIRFLTLLLLTFIMAMRGHLRELLQIKHIWKRLLMIGTLGFLLDVTAFLGLTLCPAGIGTVLLKCDIIFVNLISVFVFRYRFSRRDWGYTLLMLFGVVLVLGIDFTNVELGGIGNVFFILSALFVSINAFIIKDVQHDGHGAVHDNVIAYYNNLVTMIFFTGFAAVQGDLVQLRAFGTDPFITTALIIAALGQTLVYLIYYYNLRHFPVWVVKVFLLLMPLVTAFLAYLLFGEELVMLQYLGMAIVLIGAVGMIVEQGKNSRSLAASNKV